MLLFFVLFAGLLSLPLLLLLLSMLFCCFLLFRGCCVVEENYTIAGQKDDRADSVMHYT